MNDFHYVDGELICENTKVSDVACRVETPFYLYSRKTLTDHYRKLDSAFSSIPHLICYSLKANSNIALVRILGEMGAGADVTSGGELFKALRSGIPPERVVYAGVGKTRKEIVYALESGILMFNVESVQELHLINETAGGMNKKAKVGIRLNPDVEAETHAYITTGKRENKFGLAFDAVNGLFNDRDSFPNIEMEGIHLHIGSQITSVAPYVESIRKAVDFLQKLSVKLKWLNIGGGLGIIYRDETPSTAEEFAGAVIPLIMDMGLKVIMEPGRFIVGNAGILVTKVLYLKESGSKTFVIVDAGMNDIIRPSLYQAYHEVKPVRMGDSEEVLADVVGPICETGDFIARGRKMPLVGQDDLLAVFGAGAYGFSMASNYNARPRCPEVLVEGDSFRVVRDRERYEDLIRGETLRFAKMCAGGNDFIVVDNRNQILEDSVSFASGLCKRSYSVGADGLLLLEKGESSGRLKMRIFNPDGSEAEMCGNGARCIAAFVNREGISGKKASFETIAGLVESEVVSSAFCMQTAGEAGQVSYEVRLKMYEPSGQRLSFKLSVDGDDYTVSFINTGVPHTVVLVEDIEAVDVKLLGEKIRYNESFEPEGTNVNFVQLIDREKIRLRTYERGVEAETLSCGTGAIASAVIGYLLGKVDSPVSVLTTGGGILKIFFEAGDAGVKNVYLQGDAVFVYEGILT